MSTAIRISDGGNIRVQNVRIDRGFKVGLAVENADVALIESIVESPIRVTRGGVLRILRSRVQDIQLDESLVFLVDSFAKSIVAEANASSGMAAEELRDLGHQILSEPTLDGKRRVLKSIHDWGVWNKWKYVRGGLDVAQIVTLVRELYERLH